MDYKPRYPQPFTLAEASLLDVQTITEEIARLQNSVQRLDETQKILEQSIASDPDPELSKAFTENQTVIASQTERIGILKLALSTSHGITMGAHYKPVVSAMPEIAPAEDGGVDL
ncbi:hypothetical protein MKEN_00086100 [Mycena kentingensis (nom. inval.)]|nr:hypothetical protein MKEN_00086100 [Mycena kentingensis (nom. inval.)]